MLTSLYPMFIFVFIVGLLINLAAIVILGRPVLLVIKRKNQNVWLVKPLRYIATSLPQILGMALMGYFLVRYWDIFTMQADETLKTWMFQDDSIVFLFLAALITIYLPWAVSKLITNLIKIAISKVIFVQEDVKVNSVALCGGQPSNGMCSMMLEKRRNREAIVYSKEK